ncbi:hypothetical protein BofuT4_uP096360.1 [Botrytis cinerea T4]|uniref:Uncharacterized protein n=1 Tax=Botryotinia fuckeliana (strain T4) TaxID=999810 RepID=G2YDT0_BOTF4|nr:hypothetical protein BofuT4_uP096360.1 [Botrytis cinerea T4]
MIHLRLLDGACHSLLPSSVCFITVNSGVLNRGDTNSMWKQSSYWSKLDE